jgi:hypothetical protein
MGWRRGSVSRELGIGMPTEDRQQQHADDGGKRVLSMCCRSRAMGASRTCRARTGSHHLDCALLAIRALLDLEGNEFADAGTTAISRKGGDMDKNCICAHRRLDEAESAVIVPCGQFTVGSDARRLLGFGDAPDRACRVFGLDVAIVKIFQRSDAGATSAQTRFVNPASPPSSATRLPGSSSPVRCAPPPAGGFWLSRRAGR